MEDFSVVIIARNEETTLPRLLQSLQGVNDIVVMDTGSTDETVKVAKSHGCNVVEVGDRFRVRATKAQYQKWIERYNWEPAFKPGEGYFHFAKARNHAATFAKNDWCFMPDGDEVMTWNLAKVREAIQNEDHLTYQFCYAHEPDGSCGLLISQSKFYRKSKLRWEKWVHEVLQAMPGQNPRPPRWCDFIYHRHYQNPQTSRGQYLPGLELSVLESPEDDRNVYYLGREEMYCGHYNRAIKFFEKAIELSTWAPEQNQAYVYKGTCHKLAGEHDKAIECFHQAMMVTDTRREAYWELGALYEGQDDLPRAAVYYTAATAVPFTPQGYLSHKALYTWKIPDKLAFIHGRLGDEAESKRWWLEVLKHNPPAHLLKNGVGWFYRDDLPLISIIVPTVRKKGYERLIKSIEANTVYPKWEIIKKSGDATGAIQKLNQGVEEAKGELIVYLADDTEVRLGWLTQAFVCFKEEFRDKGLVILNDGYWEGQMANHFLCSKNIREELDGEIWHSGYHHWGVDNELHGRLKQKNLVEYCEQAKIVHHHFCTQTRGIEAAPMDEVYQKVLKWQERDRRLLYRRQRKLGFGPKVAAFTTSYNEAERIEEYVRSALQYVDEVYISDNGSTDRTAEIAKAAGAHVRQSGLVHTPESYNEGATKQRALEFAEESDCDWFLFLEPDEMLERRAAELLPEMVNSFKFDAYGMRIPTFWLGRTHYRTDGDFGKYYLTKPYPLKLWRRGCGVKMTIPKRGGHSGPALNGDPSTPRPPRYEDSELKVKHYSFDTREIALAKYERYSKADPDGVMSVTVPSYEHIHPDYPNVELEAWELLPKVDFPQEEHPERLLVVERLGKMDGRVVLDIGCGVNKTVPWAIGVDIKPVTDIQCSGDDLRGLEDGSADAIVSRHSLEHFIDPVQTLMEWRRVLKPRGKMIVVLPDHERIDTMGPAMNAGDHLHAFTQDSFDRLVDLVPGLELVEQGLAIEGWSFYAEILAV